MKKLQINNEHRALIESVIRESAKFRGNEELIDLFCDAIYKKSYLLIDAIRDTARLKRHLMMISDSCMEQIIKEKRKFEETKVYRQIEYNSRLKEDIVSVKKSPLRDEDDVNEDFRMQRAKDSVINIKEELQMSERYDSVESLIDPLEFCPQRRISEYTVDKLIQVVKAVSASFPKKRYYEIFTLRYIKKLNQSQIAQEMKISQVELSKRFVELIKLTRENI